MNKKGFSLVELLLVIGVSAGLVMVTIQLFNDFAQKQTNRMVGQHILQLQNAAEEYVSANFTDLWTHVIPNLNDTAEITPATLSAAGFLPTSYVARNALKQAVTSYVRNVGGGFTGGDTIEVVSFSEDWGGNDVARPNGRIIDAAISAGPKVGVIIETDTGPDCCEGNIQSYSGLWSVPIGTYGGNWTVTANRPDRGYIAAYGRVAYSNTFNGDYLYRVAITGQPELNRMETNLDMDNNDISGVGVATADNMSVGYSYDPERAVWQTAGTGNSTIRGQGLGSGNYTPFGLTVDNALQANEAGTASTFGFRNATGCTIDGSGTVTGNATACAGGDLIINNGTLDLATLTLDSNAGTPSFFGANIMNVDNLGATNFTANFTNTSVMGATTTTDLTAFTLTAYPAAAAGTTFDSDNLQTSAAAFGNSISANSLIAGEITNVNTLDVTGRAVVEGDVQSTGTLTTNNLTATSKFLIDNMTNCNSGC